jgi:hypothetical protein
MTKHTHTDGIDALICMRRRGVGSLGLLSELAKQNGHPAVKLLLNVHAPQYHRDRGEAK